MRGADPVTVSDRGQALHGRAEQATECFGLRLAELWILGSHVRYRAVVLTELFSPAGRRTTASRGGVAIGGQGRSERLDPLRRIGGLDRRPVPALELGDLLPRELGYRTRSGPLG